MQRLFLFESILTFADGYFYVNPKTHSPRYYKENDSNYYARISKENSKLVHQEPYSFREDHSNAIFEGIISGMYFVHLISLCENKVFLNAVLQT